MLRTGSLVGLAVLVIAPPAAGDVTADKILPNLVPRPPVVQLGDADADTGDRAVRLETGMANIGDAHLDLLGMPEQPGAQSSNVYQCVTWLTDRVCDERVEVGRFVWHAAHQHYHFANFAAYELRRLTRGRPDMSPRGLVAGGDKVSFCLMDTHEDDDPSGMDWARGWPAYISCSAGSGQQGISRGWRDTYPHTREEQQIVVDDVPAGLYAVVIRVDPKDLIFESSNKDNVVAVKIELTATTAVSLCVFDAHFERCSAPD